MLSLLAWQLMHRIGVTAVMIARGTYGNPWIFRTLKLQLKVKLPPAAIHKILASFMMHGTFMMLLIHIAHLKLSA